MNHIILKSTRTHLPCRLYLYIHNVLHIESVVCNTVTSVYIYSIVLRWSLIWLAFFSMKLIERENSMIIGEDWTPMLVEIYHLWQQVYLNIYYNLWIFIRAVRIWVWYFECMHRYMPKNVARTCPKMKKIETESKIMKKMMKRVKKMLDS